MKGGRCTVICLIMLAMLISPACADEIYPTITQVFFEKDGMPFNTTVHYTVTCYGHSTKSWNSRPEEIAAAHSTPMENVYSYTATCDHYGCDIYEPYYLNYRITESCDLTGESAMFNFTIRNFSNTPIPPDCYNMQQFAIHKRSTAPNPLYDACIDASEPKSESCLELMIPCTSAGSNLCRPIDNRSLEVTAASDACFSHARNAIRDCDIWKNRDEYYNLTPAYEQCMVESRDAYDTCYQFLDACDPAFESVCGNWIIGGRYVKKTDRWKKCTDEVGLKRQACDRYLMPVDSSLITMWISPYTGRQSGEVRRECTARFTIPSDISSDPNYVPPMQTAHFEIRSPVASFWCSIVEILGGRCE